MDLSWMAWTRPTAIFFSVIFCLLVTLTLWEIRIPGGAPRKGVLGFVSTRGDRLFVSLLGSAYIHVFWLALTGLPIWWAFVIAIVYAFFVFLVV